jgi:translation initiation factor 2B subunit (eIF-2B alpha/beta/delta family)
MPAKELPADIHPIAFGLLLTIRNSPTKVNTLNYIGKKIDLEKGFELVPSNLISRIITEKGILDPNKIAEIAKEKSKFFERALCL